jgi:REP element-mobilizing transposase RayT
MGKSYYKIWIHAVWATKNRRPLIIPEVESKVHDFIQKQLVEVGCRVSIVNGMPNHVHCLFLLNPKRTLISIIKQIKGSSSHFINQNDLIERKFAWQTGYGSFSVSESVVDKTYQYIKNQKQHHSKKSFQEEYSEFLRLYGFEE